MVSQLDSFLSLVSVQIEAGAVRAGPGGLVRTPTPSIPRASAVVFSVLYGGYRAHTNRRIEDHPGNGEWVSPMDWNNE